LMPIFSASSRWMFSVLPFSLSPRGISHFAAESSRY
jgi:hypothetical protein